jgi:hypothetical protein
MAALGHEADARLAVRATARMKDDAAAAGAMGVDKRQHRRGQAVFAQCTDNEAPFPFSVGGVLEVLEGASAARAEVRAGCRYAFGRGAAQGEKPCPCAVEFGIDDLARQRERHFDEAGRSLAETMAARAQSRYVKGYSRRHFASQRSHLGFFGHFSAFLNREKRSHP